MYNYHKYFHWYYHIKGNRALFNLGSGILIGLFLFMIQPFGALNQLNPVFFLGVTGVIIAMSLTTVLTFPFFDFLFINLLSIPLEKNHRLDFWVLMLKIFAIHHFTLIIRGFACKWYCIGVFEYFQSCFLSFLMIGTFYLFYTLYARSKYFYDMLPMGDTSRFDLILKGNGKETVKINIDALVYLKSDDNYVDLIMAEGDNKSQKQSIRATLSSLEKQLESSSQFVRIHRSYIINTKFFSSFSKGKNELELTFANQTISLPVSRKYKPTITQLFTHHK